MTLNVKLEYHPRKWVDSSDPAYKPSHQPFLLFSLSPRGARGERKKQNGNIRSVLCRLYLNNPPTPVGGILESS